MCTAYVWRLSWTKIPFVPRIFTRATMIPLPTEDWGSSREDGPREDLDLPLRIHFDPVFGQCLGRWARGRASDGRVDSLID